MLKSSEMYHFSEDNINMGDSIYNLKSSGSIINIY